MIWGCSNDGILVGVIDDPRDLLGMSLEDGHHLLRVLVEDCGVAVVASGQQLAVVRRVDVQRQDAGDGGRVETLRRCDLSNFC